MELIIQFEKPGGELLPVSREIFADSVNQARKKGGKWKVRIVEDNYTSTRYKFLFDCVYRLALPYVANQFKIVKGGTERSIENTKELHFFMKMLFNRIEIYDTETGLTCSAPGSTTDLEDIKFYNEFEEKVIAELTEREAFGDMGCPTREEWAESKKGKKIFSTF